MKTAFLYDIRGNIHALNGVLDELADQPVDRILVGGDVIPGPFPIEVLERLTTLATPTQFIYGNGEKGLLDLVDGNELALPAHVIETLRWTADQFSPDQLEFIRSWPFSIAIEDSACGNLLACHATPRNDTEIFTKRTPGENLMPILQNVEASCIVCGHTHMQFDLEVGRHRLLNSGSVGMAFGDQRAHWLLRDDESWEFKQTSYDCKFAAEAILGTKFPGAEKFANENILDPPSEEKMLKLFASVSI